jgi:DNA-binding GntR family transcriptional regulator
VLSREQFANVREIGGEAADDESVQSNLNIAYERVKTAILRTELEPGSVVSQVKLAKSLGVSRTPLREALRLLQREGLVEAQHNQRVKIAGMSVSDMEELYALRITTEALALRCSVPRLTNDDFGTLHKLVKEMDVMMERNDVDGWEVPHREFHRQLIRHAGPRSERLIRELSDQAERYRRAFIKQGMHGWATSAQEHKAILQSCERTDVNGAVEGLARHLARTSLAIFLNQAPDFEPALVRLALKSVLAGTRSQAT